MRATVVWTVTDKTLPSLAGGVVSCRNFNQAFRDSSHYNVLSVRTKALEMFKK